jgi:hypothetical protein
MKMEMIGNKIDKPNTTRVYLLFVYYKEQLLSDYMFRPLFVRPSSDRKYLYQETLHNVYIIIYMCQSMILIL